MAGAERQGKTKLALLLFTIAPVKSKKPYIPPPMIDFFHVIRAEVKRVSSFQPVRNDKIFPTFAIVTGSGNKSFFFSL